MDGPDPGLDPMGLDLPWDASALVVLLFLVLALLVVLAVAVLYRPHRPSPQKDPGRPPQARPSSSSRRPQACA